MPAPDRTEITREAAIAATYTMMVRPTIDRLAESVSAALIDA